MSVRVIGQADLSRKLAQLSRSLQGRATMTALRSGANIVVNAAKIKSPVLSGTLRRSLHQEDGERQSVLVGTDVEYARRIEYGFNDTDSLGRRFNQPAQPYLRPALMENESAIVEEVRAALRQAVESIA